ncbi:low molecular weight protein-tyrosine-phosphatase [Litorimonas sp. WD9-15]|uniref:low molecular weight protein-tyrosine-phosphatase n=1 Tax=Litorimonas sp. WD9-15 TaxID=3418716 RepID=UPI003D05C5BA
MPSVLFVCLGNICRSPTAEAVFRTKAAGTDIIIDSAGTGAWHAGEGPDPRSRAEGESRGYSFAGQAARKVRRSDFTEFDYILAMDAANLRDLAEIAPQHMTAKLSLFLPDGQDVPDPYYGGPDGFRDVVDLIEGAADHWLSIISADS